MVVTGFFAQWRSTCLTTCGYHSLMYMNRLYNDTMLFIVYIGNVNLSCLMCSTKLFLWCVYALLISPPPPPPPNLTLRPRKNWLTLTLGYNGMAVNPITKGAERIKGDNVNAVNINKSFKKEFVGKVKIHWMSSENNSKKAHGGNNLYRSVVSSIKYPWNSQCIIAMTNGELARCLISDA